MEINSLNKVVLSNLSLMLERRGYNYITRQENDIKAYIFDQQGCMRDALFVQACVKLHNKAMRTFTTVINKESELLRQWAKSNNQPCHEFKGLIIYDTYTSSGLNFKGTFETYDMGYLKFDITKHYLVSRHERATAAEIKELEEAGFLKDHLPKLLVTDPISRYYKFSEGEIIKIYRNHGADICWSVVISTDGLQEEKADVEISID